MTIFKSAISLIGETSCLLLYLSIELFFIKKGSGIGNHTLQSVKIALDALSRCA